MFTPNSPVQESAALLTTKLNFPRLRPTLVLRPRLLNHLNQGLDRLLTLVIAPAGSGKTTLVSEWLQQLSQPAAWLSLDEDDNDLARFLSYFVVALRQIDPHIGQQIESWPQSGSTFSPEPLLTAVVNDMAASSADFGLVLDDYHLIQAQPVHQAVAFLLDHPPPRLHLLITSRTEPPLPLARLRAHSQLVELNGAELRFTTAEAATFLNQVMGLGLSAPDIATLAARTEGWITGLQLAALSLQDCADIPGFITTFSGSHRYILDYLAAEVLQQQPAPLQHFLLQTSILDRLTAPLCNAVTGQPDGQTMLTRLEQANLFIIPLDDERRWYRYHHLFADFLRERLQHEVGGAGVAPLHRRAAAWYEQHGLVTEAMGHALAVADVDRAARLVEQRSRTLLRRSELRMVQNWLRQLPEESILARPRLSLFQAWAMIFTGQLDKLAALLQQSKAVAGSEAADRAESVEPEPPIPGELTAIEATIAYFRRDYRRAIELYRQALAQLPAENLFLRSAIAFSLATACNLSGDLSGAGRAFAQGRDLSQASGNPELALIADANQAQLYLEQGQLHQAAEIYREALHFSAGYDHLDLTARLQIGLAEVLYEWNDLPAASDYAGQGLANGEQGGEPVNLIAGHLILARLKSAQRDQQAAWSSVRQAGQAARHNNLPSWQVRLVAGRVQLWLRQSELQQASHEQQQMWFSPAELAFDDSAGYPAELHRLLRISQARVQLAQARSKDAAGADQLGQVIKLLVELHQELENSGRIGPWLEVLVLQALAYQLQAEVELAATKLRQALELAEPAGYVRLFLDEGEPMFSLLRQMAAAGPTTTYLDRLLAAFSAEKSISPPSPFIRPPLIEPLSERELEILRLIAAGLSNRQIADALILTVGTVKWHLNNIYGKLGVGSRTQAVAEARARRFID